MRIDTLGSNNKIICTIALLTAVILIALTVYSRKLPGVNLGDDLYLVHHRFDYVSVVNKDKEVILPTILDYRIESNYIIGIRLPAYLLSCNNRSFAKIKVLNERHYFILYKDNYSLLHFNSRFEFEEKLKELGIFKINILNYSTFDTFWKKYSKLNPKNDDVENCVVDLFKYK
jgi:hypothetical protein